MQKNPPTAIWRGKMQGAPLNFPAGSALEGYPEEICSWKPAKTVLAGKNAELSTKFRGRRAPRTVLLGK
jgi:hypothetical protein